jgi:hypothetical protein
LFIGAIIHLLKLIEVVAKEVEEVGSVPITNELWKIGAYVCTLTAASLGGHKGSSISIRGEQLLFRM